MAGERQARSPVRTRHREIIEYWSAPIELSGFTLDRAHAELGVEVDWDSPKCFACGKPRSSWVQFDRSHLVNDCEGGSDDPANLILLCAGCNQYEMPVFSSRTLAAYWVMRNYLWKVRMQPASAFHPWLVQLWAKNYAESQGLDPAESLSTIYDFIMNVMAETIQSHDDNEEWREYRQTWEGMQSWFKTELTRTLPV